MATPIMVTPEKIGMTVKDGDLKVLKIDKITPAWLKHMDPFILNFENNAGSTKY